MREKECRGRIGIPTALWRWSWATRLRAPGERGWADERLDNLRACRCRRHRVREDRRGRPGGRLMAGGHPRGGPGPLRPAVRRPGHRGRPDRGPPQVRRRRRVALADQRQADPRHARRGARGRRHRRPGRPPGPAGRRRRREGRRGPRGPRGRPRRGARPQDRPGRGGGEDRRRVHRLEVGRRPAQGDPRRVEDHPRRRQEDRRRAVEAVRRRPGRLHPPPRRPLRHPGRSAQAGAGGQGRAGQGGGEPVRLHRVGSRPPTGSRS